MDYFTFSHKGLQFVIYLLGKLFSITQNVANVAIIISDFPQGVANYLSIGLIIHPMIL